MTIAKAAPDVKTTEFVRTASSKTRRLPMVLSHMDPDLPRTYHYSAATRWGSLVGCALVIGGYYLGTRNDTLTSPSITIGVQIMVAVLFSALAAWLWTALIIDDES